MIETISEYKQTPIGKIPADWEMKKLGDISLGKGVYGINASAVDYKENLPKYLRITDIDDEGCFSTDKLSSVDDKNSKDFYLKNGDLIFVRTGSTTGKSYLYNNKDGLLVYAGFLIKFSIDNKKANDYYIWNYTKTTMYYDWVKKFSQRSGQPGLNSNEYSNLLIPLPPLSEQQKIAEVLSTWDKGIQETGSIIKRLEKRNKALAFSLLTGKTRLQIFQGDNAKLIQIKDIAYEVSLKNKSDEDYVVFSCTKYNGLVPSLEYFGKKIYSDNLTTYKIIKRKQFAYATNHIEEGSMGVLEREEIGLISPMYTVFDFNPGVNIDYIFKMLKTDFYINEYKRRMEGSIDRRGGLRWSEFSKINIYLPSLEEQNKIAEILNTATEELKKYTQKLDNLKDQKKGLMQQLLTGKVRTI